VGSPGTARHPADADAPAGCIEGKHDGFEIRAWIDLSLVLDDRLARTVPELSGLAALDWRTADELESDGACAVDP
jgi:hypothetical protein